MWMKHFQNLLNESAMEFSTYDNEWKTYIDEEVNNICHQCDPDKSPNGINMSIFTTDEVTRKLASLPNGKAPGFDHIAYEHIKYGGYHIAQCVVTLFNTVITLNQIPT